MPFDTTTINHVKSFHVLNTIEGVNEATREIFDGISTENLNRFEGFMLRNSFIASEDYTGGISETISPQTVSQSNPAGIFRSLLTPKGDTMVMEAISSLADVKFEKFGTDSISLAIDEYVRTPFKLLYPIDGAGNEKGWLVSKIQSALSMQAMSAIVRHVNYKVYNTFKSAAVVQTDNKRGAAGRVLEKTTTNKAYTNQLIEALADYNALPEDRYVTGFDDEELVIPITKQAQANLLKEKLVIYEGQKMGEAGVYYSGLPYSHLFAGVPLFVTKFMNDGKDTDLEVDYIITPIGRFAPFLFHLARFAGRAEIAPLTDGAASVYGTVLSGMKIEEKLDQYITIKPKDKTKFISKGFTGNISELTIENTGTGELTVKGKTKEAGEFAVYNQQTGEKIGSTKTLSAGNIDENITGLVSGVEYRVVIAAGTIESPETVNGKQYLAYLYARA